MTLTPQEAEQFFTLIAHLQFYVARQLEMDVPAATLEEYRTIRGPDALDYRNATWANPELITRYVAENPDGLSADKLAEIGSWTQLVQGRFILERHLKKYSIFMQNNSVYAVIGLYDELENMLPKSHLPMYVHAVLLPFKGRIIYDGLIGSYNLIIGSNMARGFKDDYMRAKRKGDIIFSFDPATQAEKEAKNTVKLKDWKPQIAQLVEDANKLRAQTGSPPTWSPAFSLVKDALRFAQAAVESPEDVHTLIEEYEKLDKTLSRLGKGIDRI